MGYLVCMERVRLEEIIGDGFLEDKVECENIQLVDLKKLNEKMDEVFNENELGDSGDGVEGVGEDAFGYCDNCRNHFGYKQIYF